jgi:DNA repair protein RadA/Sms
VQIVGDLARRGEKALYIATEQPVREFRAAVERIHSKGGALPPSVVQNLLVDDAIHDLENLPSFFTRKVLPADGEYHDVQLIVIDSLQAHGVSPNSTRKYAAFYQFLDLTRAASIPTIAVSHVNKAGEAAGPQSLAHNVDAVLYIRRGFRQRPLFVVKNRFAALTDPVILVMDGRGRLIKSPLSAAKRSSVYGLNGGAEPAEIQAVVGLPTLGHRAELVAPFVPQKRVHQLVNVIGTIPDIEVSDADFVISCYFPNHGRYRPEVDLPLCVAIVSSFVQRSVSPSALFVGEVDLSTQIRVPEQEYLRNIATLLLKCEPGRFERVFVAQEAVAKLSRLRVEKDGPQLGDVVEVIGVATLEDVIATIWPDLFQHSKSARITLAG